MPNEFRVKLIDRAKEEGFDTKLAYLEHIGIDSVHTALCTEYCDIEPDGVCEHGCPAPLVAAGLI